MNQNVTMDIPAVMEAVRASGLLVSLCTILVPPEVFDDGGAPDPNAPYTEFAGHVNIPCTAPPLAHGDNTSPAEEKSMSEIQAKNELHVLLDNYYPTIIQDYRALIDSIQYDITNVESDSQHQMTRLAVQVRTI